MTQVGHVFISHAARDDAIALRVRDALETAGIKTWLDQTNLLSGDNWEAEIDKALRSASDGLVLLSPASVKSPEVTAEWRDILIQNKALYIAIVEPLPADDIPSRLRIMQLVDLTENFDDGVKVLIEAIKNRDYDIDKALAQKMLNITPAQPAESSRVSLTLELDSDRLNNDEIVDLVSRLVKLGVQDIHVIEAGAKDAG